MKNPVTLGIVGLGVVGSGTLQLLQDHRRDIESRVGAPVRVKWICSRHPKRFPYLPQGVRQTRNWKDVVSDPEVDCIVELIGGTDPAKALVVSSLKSGKHVVTANKAILSKYWDEIFDTAHQQRRLVYFEAAVGGGVPMVQALNEGLAGNEIRKLVGILNGTTNFILTKMQETGSSFEDALKEAQAAGFAEADPTFDVEGMDAAQKISILASLATGRWISPTNVHCEGITRLQSVDMRMIQERLHSAIKLLAIAESTPRGWVLRVHPTLVPKTHPFANVRNEYNALMLYGNAVGDVMLYGRGAGRLPTSSAVVSDIIFLSRQIANGTAGQLPYVTDLKHRNVKIGKISTIKTRYYLRITTLDRPGILSRVTGILGRNGVSIAAVHQDTFEEASSKRAVPIILLTHLSEESAVQASVRAIDRLPAIRAKTVVLRME